MDSFPVDNARLMTLAGIAYGAVEKIPDYLSKAELLSDHWSVVWIPATGQNPDNLAFLALNAKDNAAVLAIRGTYPNPLSPIYWENGQQDSPFGPMVPWDKSASAKISKGTNTGFQNLSGLKDASGKTIADAVSALGPSVHLCVTGHSLGGTLAPVMALSLSDNGPSRAIHSVSFAGMTPGNAAFAELFGPGSALHGRTLRVFNTLDSVSFGWNRVLATRNFFDPAPKGGIAVKLFLLLAWVRLWIGRYGYAAIGQDVPLSGAVKNPGAKHGLVSFVIETLHQHMPDTYLGLLGAPPLPFSILFGSVITDRVDLPDQSGAKAALPVFHT